MGQVEALQQIFREIDRENDNEVNFEAAMAVTRMVYALDGGSAHQPT